MNIRKINTYVDEVLTEGGRPVDPPARTAVVVAVIENPWAGQGFVEDLAPGIDATASDLGKLLADRVVEALGGPVEAFGKAAIVGLDGEIEHGSALIHTLKFGDHFRRAAEATTLLPGGREARGCRHGVRHTPQARHRRHDPLPPPEHRGAGGRRTARRRDRGRAGGRRSRAARRPGSRPCPPSSDVVMLSHSVAGAGPDVVLLHGVGLDHTMWDRCLPALVEEHRVTTVDLRGHGASGPASPGTSLGDLADDVLEVIDAVGAARVHLVGFSLGALVAAYLAEHHRDRVATLSLVSSVALRTPEEREAVRRRLEAAAGRPRPDRRRRGRALVRRGVAAA